MAEDTLKIEISFPVKVELTQDDMRQFDAIAGEICDRYKAAHPGRVMWPAGVGSKVLYMPMTREEELAGKHMEFDDAVFAIDCAEREDFDYPCAKCGIEQGEHSHCIIDGKAGDCEFEPAAKPAEPTRERGLVPMHVYLSAVKGRRDMRAALRAERDKVKALEADSMNVDDTRKSVLAALKQLNEEGLGNDTHIEADGQLCRLLRTLGYEDVVTEYHKLDKWYA